MTCVSGRSTPSSGTSGRLFCASLPMLSSSTSQVMEMVQVQSAVSATCAFSGSTGWGLPSGTGSVW